MRRSLERAWIGLAVVLTGACAAPAGTQDAAATDAPAQVDATAADVQDASAEAGVGSLTPCDPFATSACPTGEVCSLVSSTTSDQMLCIRVAAPRTAGQTCTVVAVEGPRSNPTRSGTNCATGLLCVRSAGETQSRCEGLCTSRHTGCPGGQVCLQLLDDAGGNNGAAGVCRTETPAACDPVTQTGCGAGQGCYLLYLVGSAPQPWCAGPPAAADAIGENERCTNGGCGLGFTCAPNASQDGGLAGRACRRFCDPSADAGANGCSPSTPTCTLLPTTATTRPVGVCR